MKNKMDKQMKTGSGEKGDEVLGGNNSSIYLIRC